MARKYAALANNSVVAILTLDDVDVAEESRKHQLLVDVEDMSPQPQIGWNLVGNKLAPTSALPLEQIIQAKIKRAREFGAKLTGEATDRIGAKNVLGGKTEAQVLEIAALLQPIKQLLEGGALNTAKTQLLAVKPMLDPALQVEIDWAVEQITGFLTT